MSLFRLQTSLSLYLTFVFTGCGIGLQTNGPLFDSGYIEEPSSEPSNDSDPWGTDTDSDTDITDTNDTSDTNSGPGNIPNLISSVSPLYGSTDGSTEVTILGGPFTSDATVSFGGTQGLVRSNNGSMLRVNTPSASIDGAVEIRVDMDDGYGIADDAYVYFADSLGKTATIGVIGKVEYIGQYWNGGVVPDPSAHMWTAFTSPLDVHFWQLSTPALNTCARNGIDANGDGFDDDVNGDGVVNNGDFYQFSGNLTVIDVGANSVTMTGTNGILLTRGSNDPNSINYYMYEYSGDLDPSMVPDNAFYDLSISGGALDGMTVAQYGRASKRSAPVSPSLNTATLQAVSRTQTFSWNPTGADWVEIRMYQVNDAGFISSDVICNVNDTGGFNFQNIHHSWTVGQAVYVHFTRVFESNISMPHNDGISRIIGAYTIVGAGYMN